MFNHLPVLLTECINALDIKPDGVYVDCTTGGGGHSLKIVENLSSGKLICFDKDSDAITASKERLAHHFDKTTWVNSNFFDIKHELANLGITAVDGILADLGISSFQIDTAERGFSYMHNGPLDMRMCKTQDLTAEKVVNNYCEADLKKILFQYGEEKHTNAIVSKILIQRAMAQITTTFQLKEIVASCYPAKDRYKPAVANKVFQAIRIEVNGELKGLEQSIEDMISLLKPRGKLAVISFHTLEDRIVKQTFRTHSTNCICPPDFPMCVCKHKADIKLCNNKPIIPSVDEQQKNSRSISAKLRVVEKL